MECINKECDFNNNGRCNHQVVSNTCVLCEKRIDPMHTPNYAEEQLEHAKAKEESIYTLCYNKECQHYKKNNKCGITIALECSSLMKEPINYEEEYYKLKKAIEVKDKRIKWLEAEKENLESDRRLREVIKKNEKLEEQVKRLGKSTNEYYYNWIECQEENKILETKIKTITILIESIKKLSEVL